ncbi:cytochrome c [Hydrogenivirga caldilitoris]|uniref:Cytochrome c n=1 Tax=Hydrogenivirga caldilitoris TaxID=246264 RepID=A0A497XRW9_9AQUI|nr:cytochrome D1 domain-containing protein [Hydrogenivirga caldilitoris]RLJ70839.1 cytochrome c [Hydrogenivirga caldilitoris]
MASLISLRSLAPSLPLFFFLFSFADDGRGIYLKHCASCHHEDRIGRTAPPLLPEFLGKKNDDYLVRVIKEGIPASSMPSFGFLSEKDVKKLIDFIRKPSPHLIYTLKDIENSYTKLEGNTKKLGIKDVKNLIVAVDRGSRKVSLIEESRVLDSFPFGNVHGGVKFSPGGRDFYVPARDGWIAHYSVEEGRLKEKIRACIYLRNIALSPSGNRLLASCVLPKSLLLMDKNLKPLKKIELEGRPGAVYELNKSGHFILTFRDKPYVALVNQEGDILYKRIDSPLEDFFIDPLERFIVGSSRKEGKLLVYELESLKKVFEREVPGLPHLFSASFWYTGGSFYFATRHIGSTKVSIWRMYDWELVKEIDTGGKGFFVRTNSKVPDLWIDNGGGEFILIDKKSLEVKRFKASEGGQATHVEFSADGRFAYVSVVGGKRGLYLYDPLSLEPLGKIPAEYPVGKYNFVNKSRSFDTVQLGYQVFMEKCWGCHHTTKEAFGPPFKWIAKHRNKAQIVSQMLNPEETAKLLGYDRNAMPKIALSPEEVEVLLSLIESLKGDEEDKHAKTE